MLARNQCKLKQVACRITTVRHDTYKQYALLPVKMEVSQSHQVMQGHAKYPPTPFPGAISIGGPV